MIDNFAIIFSTLITVFVIWRAARLDRTLPWFAPAPDVPDAPKADSGWRNGPDWRKGPGWRGGQKFGLAPHPRSRLTRFTKPMPVSHVGPLVKR